MSDPSPETPAANEITAELTAMQAVATALLTLSPAARTQVLE
jgi:hypothetical protein